jgi:ubiquinol-cytochrome c reductase cytochrome b subunit
MAFYGVLWEAGGNDIIAIKLHLNLNYITYFNRVMVFAGPLLAFWITRRWCISLQRADQDRLLHGYESGVIMRSPEGAYAEKHLPISEAEAYTLTARDRDMVIETPTAADENGVANRKVALMRLHAKASQLWFGNNLQKPTREELEAAQHHAEHELEQHELAGSHEDGHTHDRHGIEGNELKH